MGFHDVVRLPEESDRSKFYSFSTFFLIFALNISLEFAEGLLGQRVQPLFLQWGTSMFEHKGKRIIKDRMLLIAPYGVYWVRKSMSGKHKVRFFALIISFSFFP
jgi:hypothetical protein